MDTPDLGGYFPLSDPSLKISSDLDNQAHGSHFDVMQAIQGGTDQARVSPQGDILGGTTNIGPIKMDW